MLWFVVLSKRAGKPRRLVLSAACKINLALEVLGRRDDGYHEIATVMQAVDLSDRLTLEDAPAIEVRTSALDVPTDERNLAYRAAAVYPSVVILSVPTPSHPPLLEDVLDRIASSPCELTVPSNW